MCLLSDLHYKLIMNQEPQKKGRPEEPGRRMGSYHTQRPFQTSCPPGCPGLCISEGTALSYGCNMLSEREVWAIGTLWGTLSHLSRAPETGRGPRAVPARPPGPHTLVGSHLLAAMASPRLPILGRVPRGNPSCHLHSNRGDWGKETETCLRHFLIPMVVFCPCLLLSPAQGCPG
jgi:hypothetical protein